MIFVSHGRRLRMVYSQGSMLDLKCEWCTSDITFNENANNAGLCDACFQYTVPSHTKKSDTPIVRGCDNYLKCGNEANISMGNGLLCDPCRNKVHEDIKKVFMNSPTGKKALAKFINGLQKALSVE